MDENTLKDIQFLLIQWEGSLDNYTSGAWENQAFVNMCNKYGFNKNNLYKGLEELSY